MVLDVIKFSEPTKSPSKIQTSIVRFGIGTTIKNNHDSNCNLINSQLPPPRTQTEGPFCFTSNPSLTASSILDKFPVSTLNFSAINNLGMNEGEQPVFFHTNKEDSFQKTQIILTRSLK